MRAGQAPSATFRPRASLLALLVGLCLVVVAGPARATPSHLAPTNGHTATAVTSLDGVAARSASADRLTPRHLATPSRHLPLTAGLSGVALALLLGLRVRRHRVIRTPRNRLLLLAAGRDPPSTS